MNRASRWISGLLPLALVACGSDATAPKDQTSPTGSAEHLTVDVSVTKDDEARTPVEGAIVAMSCFMPEHGHGMLREPGSEELGEGKYLVSGFLLHMDGYWTVSVNLLVDGLAATAEDELRL